MISIHKLSILQVVIITGIGIIIGLLLQKPQLTDVASPSISELDSATKNSSTFDGKQNSNLDSSQQIAQIQSQLTQEIDNRKQLQEQVTKLQEQLAKLNNTNSTDNGDMSDTQNRPSTTISTAQSSRMNMAQNHSWFNESALLEVGVDEAEANRLRQLYEQVEMDKLYLRDKAIREGWMGQSKYRKERDALDAKLDSLRDDLDETTYDAFLYASGRPNRVVVNSALTNSPAAKAGIQPGDTVLKYNNKKVYTAGELRDLTTQGELNALVSVEYERNGEIYTVYVPSGPLGIKMFSRSLTPNQ